MKITQGAELSVHFELSILNRHKFTLHQGHFYHVSSTIMMDVSDS